MIIIDVIEVNGRQYTKTHSDDGRYVVRNGVNYISAVDPIGSFRVYSEGDVYPIYKEPEEN